MKRSKHTKRAASGTFLKNPVKECGADSKSQAVAKAEKDNLRMRNIGKIIGMRGKIEFDLSADEIRHFVR